jgi:hypothetical protein
MSSLRREYNQNVLRSYVVTQDANNSESGAYFFAESDVDTWYAANKSKITKLGKTLYVIVGSTAGSTFADVLRGSNGATELEHSLTTIDQRKTLKDMGKEIIIGNRTVARLFVLRRVQLYINSADSGTLNTDDTGYVVVENNASDLQGNTGRFTVRVARI